MVITDLLLVMQSVGGWLDHCCGSSYLTILCVFSIAALNVDSEYLKSTALRKKLNHFYLVTLGSRLVCHFQVPWHHPFVDVRVLSLRDISILRFVGWALLQASYCRRFPANFEAKTRCSICKHKAVCTNRLLLYYARLSALLGQRFHLTCRFVCFHIRIAL